MNIIFLTLFDFKSYSEHNIYCDLLREYIKHGHKVYCISPAERRTGIKTHFEEKGRLLKLKIGNTQKTNIVEKGISTMLIEPQFVSAIKKYFSTTKFDLIIYSTPPITFAGVISYIKNRDGAKNYLLLKDIFPQNAVDIGMMTKTGPKSIIYKLFKKKEEKLYRLSDYIGCMSEANVDYIIKNNPYINPEKVHVNPNSIEFAEYEPDTQKKAEIYKKYGIPETAKTFIYGGNLGRPQGIPFIIECLKANADKSDRFFVICGKGTEYPKLKAYVEEFKPQNVLLLNGLPKAEYEEFVKAFDIGLIFLDHRFTIPNFPSRLLSYMQSKMPVLACTDPNTDIGKVIVEGGFGWWCESNSVDAFTKVIDTTLSADLKTLGENGYNYLKENYTVENGYNIIMDKVSRNAFQRFD